MLSLVTKTKNIIFGVVVRLKRFNDIIEIALKYNKMGKESGNLLARMECAVSVFAIARGWNSSEFKFLKVNV